MALKKQESVGKKINTMTKPNILRLAAIINEWVAYVNESGEYDDTFPYVDRYFLDRLDEKYVVEFTEKFLQEQFTDNEQ